LHLILKEYGALWLVTKGYILRIANLIFTTGERVGCAVLVVGDETTSKDAESVLANLQRSEVSNPPAYGALVASTILNNPELKQAWEQDLVTMSSRIREMRNALFTSLKERGKFINPSASNGSLIMIGAPGDWSHIMNQSGMFGFLGLSPKVVSDLRGNLHATLGQKYGSNRFYRNSPYLYGR
jgi:aspartate aminotransferase, cytoplasmic